MCNIWNLKGEKILIQLIKRHYCFCLWILQLQWSFGKWSLQLIYQNEQNFTDLHFYVNWVFFNQFLFSQILSFANLKRQTLQKKMTVLTNQMSFLWAELSITMSFPLYFLNKSGIEEKWGLHLLFFKFKCQLFLSSCCKQIDFHSKTNVYSWTFAEFQATWWPVNGKVKCKQQC